MAIWGLVLGWLIDWQAARDQPVVNVEAAIRLTRARAALQIGQGAIATADYDAVEVGGGGIGICSSLDSESCIVSNSNSLIPRATLTTALSWPMS